MTDFRPSRRVAARLALAAALTPLLTPLGPRRAGAQDDGSGGDADSGGDSVEALMRDRVMGADDAPVTLYEYASLTCPHCRSFHQETLPKLKADYIEPGKVKLVYRDFPLDAPAAAAAMLTRCAPEERYFPLVSTLFDKQSEWSGAEQVLQALGRYGRFAGMSETEIAACFQNQALFNAIRAKREDYAEAHDISSTPTFVVAGAGGETSKIVGAQPYETFAEKIDARLGV